MSRASKFLSYVLRHHPEAIGIELDRHGWVRIENLLRALKAAGRPMTRTDLEDLVASNDKKRFTISADGWRIRAAQGHSLSIDLDLAPATPPETLYHGTARANLDHIFQEGLKPGRRQQVHLSPDPETAFRVGSRHGRAVILTVATGNLHRDGHVFYQADNGVWLTSHIPPFALGFHSSPS